jgi:hypothetical protein
MKGPRARCEIPPRHSDLHLDFRLGTARKGMIAREECVAADVIVQCVRYEIHHPLLTSNVPETIHRPA